MGLEATSNLRKYFVYLSLAYQSNLIFNYTEPLRFSPLWLCQNLMLSRVLFFLLLPLTLPTSPLPANALHFPFKSYPGITSSVQVLLTFSSYSTVIGYTSFPNIYSVNFYIIVWIFNDLFTNISHLLNHGHLESEGKLCPSLSLSKGLIADWGMIDHQYNNKLSVELYAILGDLTANNFTFLY